MKKPLFHLLIVLFAAAPLCAADFTVTVTDAKGNPVENAVVALKPETVPPLSAETAPAQIIQKGKQFLPLVTVIQAGGKVEFPNQDSVQHHVYSFSKPKRFDIPLYKQSTPKPVVFETAGVVILSCNIHDWMKAYIFVAGTPYFAKSGLNGVARIVGLPSGKFQVEFWHPRLKKFLGNGLPQFVDIKDASNEVFSLSIELKKEIASERTTGAESGTYQ